MQAKPKPQRRRKFFAPIEAGQTARRCSCQQEPAVGFIYEADTKGAKNFGSRSPIGAACLDKERVNL